jgi:hypothetical protein
MLCSAAGAKVKKKISSQAAPLTSPGDLHLTPSLCGQTLSLYNNP